MNPRQKKVTRTAETPEQRAARMAPARAKRDANYLAKRHARVHADWIADLIKCGCVTITPKENV